MTDNWRTTDKRTVLENDHWLTVELHTVELPDGTIIDDWSWVILPDYINVVVQTADGDFALFRQTKYGIDGQALAPVGGYIDTGETPLEAAKRELMEEMGMHASEWVPLGQSVVDANRGCGVGNYFLARGAEKVAEPNADDLEAQELVMLSPDELRDALWNGAFKVLSWAHTVSMALHYLHNRPPHQR